MAGEEAPNPVVLLGAGASVDAGVPATFEMTEKLVEGINGEQHYSHTTEALNFVCGALVAYDAAAGASPYAGLDVERVFAAVGLLAERRTLEVSPFVSAWHPAVDAWDRPREPTFFGKDLKRALMSRFDSDIGRELKKFVDSLMGTRTGETYKQLADRMIAQLRTLVATTPKQVDYLVPLVTASRRPGGLTVATLNYDLSVEFACEAADVQCSTGIERWARDRRWHWPRDGVRLLKLHGSIDWAWDHQRPDRDSLAMPHKTVARVPNPQENRGQPVVIFGQRGKLSAEGPFLSLLAEFEKQLAAASELVVIGYSFRDDHINEAIRQWTTDDQTRTITIVDPALDPDRPERRHNGFREELLGSLNPPRYSPEQPPALGRVRIMTSTAAEALPQLFPTGSPGYVGS